MADAVEKKLDMSLDQITDERSQEQYSSNSSSGHGNGHGNGSGHGGDADTGFPFHDPSLSPRGYGGKYRNTRRADRMAHSAPYQPRAPRFGGGSTTSGAQWQEYPASQPPAAAGESRAAQRVYVGNLSWGVTWQMLKDHMRAAGDVQHVDILESGGRSKGCAVVTFATTADAEEAVFRLNDTVLDGRTIFVRNDREDRRARPNSGCRVYVGNLAWNIKWQDLKDHMKQVGRVVHADVLEEPNGRSKGCGLVEYSTRQEALAAIEQLTNSTLGDRMIFVREDREPEGGSISEIVKRTRSGVLGGGPPPFAAPHPGGLDYFAPPPPLFHHHPHQFAPPHHHPHAHGHHHPFAPPFGPPPILGGERQVFIGNLPLDTHWKSLKDLFRTVGPVERAEVPEFPDGRVRGFGIVRFYNSQHAWEAIERYDRAEVNGHVITVRMDRNGQ